MANILKTALLLGLAAAMLLGARPSTTVSTGPSYTRDGRLAFPAGYREWVYLSSGFDMSYRPGPPMPGSHMFDNVFADPHSYAAFVRSGHWPDKTMLVLETRAARSKGSINVFGQFQRDIMGVEVHLRDTARFRGGWAFFAFDGSGAPGVRIPPAASCYACHSAHAAVDTTFVQFYPTLLPIAERHGTVVAHGSLRPADAK